MERKMINELLKWKRDSLNKPFFLYGPRQIGKTYSVLEFGKKFYKNIAYFNMHNNTDVLNILNNEKVIDKIIMKLSILVSESIFQEDTLIVFDNCYTEDEIKSLKVLSSEHKYHIVCISSNRELINKYRLENFYYRPMFGMDFEEYLQNSDKAQLIDFIKDSFETMKPMPFHQMAMDAYYEYLETGGFPETINALLNGESDLVVEDIKNKIISIYEAEYARSDMGGINYSRCNDIINSLPSQLVKENKKFQYGVIKKGSRSKDYEECINSLVTNNILNRSYRLTDVKSPLSSCRDNDSFKLYFNDVSLLYTLLHLNRSRFLMDSDIRRTLIENNVANILTSLGNSLYYYQSDGKAEVTFVIQTRNGVIIPIEVVNMKLTKAKALSLFNAKYNIENSIKVTEDNFSKKKGMRYIPSYAVFCLKDL